MAIFATRIQLASLQGYPHTWNGSKILCGLDIDKQNVE